MRSAAQYGAYQLTGDVAIKLDDAFMAAVVDDQSVDRQLRYSKSFGDSRWKVSSL